MWDEPLYVNLDVLVDTHYIPPEPDEPDEPDEPAIDEPDEPDEPAIDEPDEPDEPAIDEPGNGDAAPGDGDDAVNEDKPGWQWTWPPDFSNFGEKLKAIFSAPGAFFSHLFSGLVDLFSGKNSIFDWLPLIILAIILLLTSPLWFPLLFKLLLWLIKLPFRIVKWVFDRFSA
jgi:hypothetical protein